MTKVKVGTWVEVNIASRNGLEVWRPALVTAVWENEFTGPVTIGLNVQIFLDGHNDHSTLCEYLRQSYSTEILPSEEVDRVRDTCKAGMMWQTSLPHVDTMAAFPYEYRGMPWRYQT